MTRTSRPPDRPSDDDFARQLADLAELDRISARRTSLGAAGLATVGLDRREREVRARIAAWNRRFV